MVIKCPSGLWQTAGASVVFLRKVAFSPYAAILCAFDVYLFSGNLEAIEVKLNESRWTWGYARDIKGTNHLA